MTTRQLLADERAELIALLHTLSDDEWTAPSLCAGWQVRDIVGHLLYDTMTLLSYAGVAARQGFSPDRTNRYLVERARSLSIAELLQGFENAAGTITRLAPAVGLADLLVHQQDIRRPLGRERKIAPERLRAVLDRPDPFARPWRYTRGLRFVATDIDYARGSGPEVRGTGEALALAVVGRPIVLDELDGDGVPELRRRFLGA
ncbi:maleylpyruvate isomerase family mycothiol-dependent enzyme [Nocardia stercoris]|uniref:Maleylpyruvate isomerase family mycothiol-dependent enzyme n=1 Tax=Nocardia stercoris TaxID=2483361 RepID=A0A3M2KX23_9NOCA|nr:maleylpyruvate isomerase family mycothiol-dependent enzyme [Nocardia stercoris]RMI29801.1 maleylpyruvate isomerase family mycothiol-dependent enzyme [Nocardia stercoris]